MLVRDWMTKAVEVVRPEDDVETVLKRLRDRGVRQFPVVSDGKLVGIITDRDVRSQRDPQAKTATVMTPEPVTTTGATPVEEAAALLRARKIGALPVVDGGELVGIVSESDLLAALVELCDLLEPETFIDLECEAGHKPLQRIRTITERHGGRITWMSGVPDTRGRQYVALRVRMPAGKAPERMLEEAGFETRSCVTGRTVKFEMLAPRNKEKQEEGEE